MQYELPPPQDKVSPISESREGFFARYADYPAESPIDRFILSTYLGTSRQVAQEIAFRAGGADALVSDVCAGTVWEVFSRWFADLDAGRVTPTLVLGPGGSPADFAYAAETYRGAGYDALALTDHRKVTVPGKAPDGLLMIPGIELDYMQPQCAHVIGLGMEPEIASEWKREGTPQQGIDAITRLGGVALLAHPAWSLNTPAFIASLEGICGVEIWNSVSTLPHNADRADSSSLLDVTWATGGRLLSVFANDDGHFYTTEATVAATMVQAESLTCEGILDALHHGRFYGTLGPRIFQIENCDNREIIVQCSEADSIIFYSSRPWVANRSRMGSGMTGSVYEVQTGDRFVRVEIRDTMGRKAWSGPIAVE